MKKNVSKPMITATEVGEFLYCAKAWQLKRAGVKADSPKLQQGIIYHQKHSARLLLALRLRWIGLGSLLLVGGALLLWWWQQNVRP